MALAPRGLRQRWRWRRGGYANDGVGAAGVTPKMASIPLVLSAPSAMMFGHRKAAQKGSCVSFPLVLSAQ
jgi:hypothetical protein